MFLNKRISKEKEQFQKYFTSVNMYERFCHINGLLNQDYWNRNGNLTVAHCFFNIGKCLNKRADNFKQKKQKWVAQFQKLPICNDNQH